MTDEQDLRDLIDSVMSSGPDDPDAGFSPAAWQTLVELGLATVGVPESAGGSGGTFDDVAVLVESVAGHGASCALLEATVANWVLACADEPVSTSASVVVADEGLVASGETLSGTLRGIPWARTAGQLVVVPLDGPGRLVDLSDRGVTVTPAENVAGEPCDTVRFDRAPARALAGVVDRELVRARLGVLWTAAIRGAASAAYDLTRKYVMTREQFGAPLVRIPAVAGALATMRVHVLQTGTGLERALETWRDESRAGARPAAAAVARITAGAAATEVARLAHQLHGAIGITREYPLHRLTRRLWAWRDAETPEHEWARMLGDTALASGEPGLWDELSA